MLAHLDMVTRRLPAVAGADAPAGETERELEGRVLHWGVRLVIAAVIFQTVAHLVDLIAFDLRYEFFDADSDEGLFSFASSAATLISGVGAALLAAVWRTHRWVPLLAAVLLAYLAIDDKYAVHDRVGSASDFELFGLVQAGRLAWPLIFLPILGSCLLALLTIAGALREGPARLIHLGLLLLVVAIAFEVATIGLVNLGYDAPSVPYEIEVAIEEGLELYGFGIIAVGLCTGALGAAASRASASRRT